MPSPNPSLYERAAFRLRDVFIEHRAELKPIAWKGRHFPWDEFCKANPAARELSHQVNRELNYELSEHQCSWAAVVFCTIMQPKG